MSQLHMRVTNMHKLQYERIYIQNNVLCEARQYTVPKAFNSSSNKVQHKNTTWKHKMDWKIHIIEISNTSADHNNKYTQARRLIKWPACVYFISAFFLSPNISMHFSIHGKMYGDLLRWCLQFAADLPKNIHRSNASH
jgi:hypothetical protein